MATLGSSRKKKDTRDREARETIKRIAYEHGMSYQEAATKYERMLSDA